VVLQVEEVLEVEVVLEVYEAQSQQQAAGEV
jgi:hypothetical protein